MACSRCLRPMMEAGGYRCQRDSLMGWRCGGMGCKYNPLHRLNPHESMRMIARHTMQTASLWTTETPTSPGWYWLHHAVFRRQAGIWHELHPMIVELSRNDNGPLMLSVYGDDGASSIDDLIVGEWVGPLVPLQ
jgi:hypothetical protein